MSMHAPSVHPAPMVSDANPVWYPLTPGILLSATVDTVHPGLLVENLTYVVSAEVTGFGLLLGCHRKVSVLALPEFSVEVGPILSTFPLSIAWWTSRLCKHWAGGGKGGGEGGGGGGAGEGG